MGWMDWLNDRFPFSPEKTDGRVQPPDPVLRVSERLGRLTERYFQVKVYDTENIPAEGGALVVANHGFLAVESSVLYSTVLRQTGRVLRPVAAHMIWELPLVNHAALALGAVRGDRETVVDVLRRGELMLVYPGGVREASKPSRLKEQLLWDGRMGFVKVALRAGVPIIPTAISGADDVYFHLSDRVETFGRWLGDPDAALPWFIGLGPLPLPTPLTIMFGAPIPMEGGEEAAEDESYVSELQQKIRAAVEGMLAGEVAVKARNRAQ